MIRPFNKTHIPRLPNLEFDWSQAGSLPITLEIGCGDGEHALQFVHQNPQIFMIALERTNAKFQSFSKKLKNLASPPANLMATQADAIHWCAHNLEKGPMLSQIFLLYPNPYPKKKQANLRFVNMPFMGFLLEHLKPGGLITIATNINDYYLEARRNFLKTWGLEIYQETLISPSSMPRTAFERKYLARGETCYNLVLKKP